MPAERKPGYDHPFYDWSPIVNRKPVQWPDNARVAVAVILSVDHYQWKPTNDFVTGGEAGAQPEWAFKSPQAPGGVSAGGRPFPDVIGFSIREYGPRVGVFRVMKILDRLGVKATVAIDAMSAENFPYLVNQFKQRNYEFMAHGIAVNQMLTSNMTPEQERDYIRRSIDAVTKATGSTPRGWLGPEFGESNETANILADEGVEFVCDWPNDDQPYPMKTPTGDLYSLPVNISLVDLRTHWYGGVHVDTYAKMIMDSFDVIYREGADSGRILVLNIHPWLMGTAFRSKHLDNALSYIFKHSGVWNATASEIVDCHRKQTNK
jgi:allantoinase